MKRTRHDRQTGKGQAFTNCPPLMKGTSWWPGYHNTIWYTPATCSWLPSLANQRLPSSHMINSCSYMCVLPSANVKRTLSGCEEDLIDNLKKVIKLCSLTRKKFFPVSLLKLTLHWGCQNRTYCYFGLKMSPVPAGSFRLFRLLRWVGALLGQKWL